MLILPIPLLRVTRRFCLVAFLLGIACTVAQAGPSKHDHDHARRALASGEARPITEILQAVAAEVPGDVIDVEFERERRHGPAVWVYEIKIITPDGRLLEVRVDAATARILDVEED